MSRNVDDDLSDIIYLNRTLQEQGVIPKPRKLKASAKGTRTKSKGSATASRPIPKVEEPGSDEYDRIPNAEDPPTDDFDQECSVYD